MSRLSRKTVGNVKSLELAFDFAQTGPQWSAPFPRNPGTCYWVIPLVKQ